MKNCTKIISLVVVCVMMVCALCACQPAAPSFKIGVSGPLTGGAAQYGVAVVNAAQMAVDEINAAGGLFGNNFELLTYDDEHKPSKVATGYASLLEKGMQVSLGCVTSDPCTEFKALAKEDNVFFITPSATQDEVPCFANGYQMCFADSNQGINAAQYVNENYGGQTIGILYCDGDVYSEGIYNTFMENVSPSVTCVVATFTDGATDFTAQVSKLANCEFIFMPIYYTPASQFMTEALNKENSIKVYYGCDGLDGIDAIKGFDINTIPQEVSYLSHFSAASEDAVVVDFVQKYTERYGEAPSQFAASAYDCVYAIYNAMKKAGEDKVSVDMTADELCTVLCGQFDNGFTFSGVTGSGMTWNRKTTNHGYVEKPAIKFIVKEASN